MLKESEQVRTQGLECNRNQIDFNDRFAAINEHIHLMKGIIRYLVSFLDPFVTTRARNMIFEE